MTGGDRGAAEAAPATAAGGGRVSREGGTGRTPAGFTLVEVLAALAIGGIVAAAVVAGVRTLTTWSSEARTRAREANRAAAIRRQIEGWLAGIAPPAGREARDLRFRDRSTAAGEADDVLGWATLAESPFASGRVRVRISVDRDSATAERGLVAELSGGDRPGVRRVELVPGASGLDARFLPPGPGASWAGSWSSTRQLPRAVELRLEGDSLPALLRAPVVVTWRGR